MLSFTKDGSFSLGWHLLFSVRIRDLLVLLVQQVTHLEAPLSAALLRRTVGSMTLSAMATGDEDVDEPWQMADGLEYGTAVAFSMRCNRCAPSEPGDGG